MFYFSFEKFFPLSTTNYVWFIIIPNLEIATFNKTGDVINVYQGYLDSVSLTAYLLANSWLFQNRDLYDADSLKEN